jgi:hypothetical protein
MSTALIAALVSASVAVLTTILAAPLRVWVEQNLQSYKLRGEYEYEQRRELRKLIGRYHGRLVQAAEQLHYRLLNIYAHDPEPWLKSRDGFFFKTSCYRLMEIIGLSRAFERDAFYIDSRIAETNDLDFFKFVKSFIWVLTSTDLVEGLEHNEAIARDHFFADQLRLMGDTFCPPKGDCLTLAQFNVALNQEPDGEGLTEPFDEIQSFLVGLSRSESRLRWDRLVSLHLFVIGFLNTAGYRLHESSEADIRKVVSQIRHPEVLDNFRKWLPRLDLDKQEEMQVIARAMSGFSTDSHLTTAS